MLGGVQFGVLAQVLFGGVLFGGAVWSAGDGRVDGAAGAIPPEPLLGGDGASQAGQVAAQQATEAVQAEDLNQQRLLRSSWYVEALAACARRNGQPAAAPTIALDSECGSRGGCWPSRRLGGLTRRAERPLAKGRRRPARRAHRRASWWLRAAAARETAIRVSADSFRRGAAQTGDYCARTAGHTARVAPRPRSVHPWAEQPLQKHPWQSGHSRSAAACARSCAAQPRWKKCDEQAGNATMAAPRLRGASALKHLAHTCSALPDGGVTAEDRTRGWQRAASRAAGQLNAAAGATLVSPAPLLWGLFGCSHFPGALPQALALPRAPPSLFAVRIIMMVSNSSGRRLCPFSARDVARNRPWLVYQHDAVNIPREP